MQLSNPAFKELSQQEMNSISGGVGWAAVAAIYGAILAGAASYGYYQGKQDCPPPPC